MRFFGGAPLVDDRGEAYEPRGEEALRALPRRMTVEQARMLRRVVEARQTRLMVAYTTMWMLLLVAMIVVHQLGLPAWMMFASFVPAGMVLVLMLMLLLRRPDAYRPVAAVLVENGVCAACAQTLRDLDLRDDGCVVCPECGAAWRGDRIRRYLGAMESGTVHPNREARIRRGWILMTSQKGRDDRGNRVPMVHRSELRAAAASSADPVRAAALRDVRQRLDAIGRGYRRVLAVLAFLLFVLPMIYGLLSLSRVLMIPQLPLSAAVGILFSSFLIPLIGLGCGVSLIYLALYGNAGRSAARVRGVMLEHSLCPSCMAPLQGGTAEADGCTACPGCGAAWRVGETPAGAASRAEDGG